MVDHYTCQLCEEIVSVMSYRTLAECTVAGVRVQKLKSSRTGILVYLAQVEGPLVNGYFCLGTG